jgi:ubiquinone biosynthesis protein
MGMIWMPIFGVVVGRLLGFRIGFLRGLISGVIGLGMGSLTVRVTPGTGPQDLPAFLVSAILARLVSVATLEFLGRPTALGRLEQSLRGVPQPIRALRRRAARSARYVSIISIAARHGLLSGVAGLNATSGSQASARLR